MYRNRFQTLDLEENCDKNTITSSVIESIPDLKLQEQECISNDGFQVVSRRKTKVEKIQDENHVRLWFFGRNLAFVPYVRQFLHLSLTFSRISFSVLLNILMVRTLSFNIKQFIFVFKHVIFLIFGYFRLLACENELHINLLERQYW